jgi:hypothetical protein
MVVDMIIRMVVVVVNDHIMKIIEVEVDLIQIIEVRNNIQ